jgi:DNA-binding XRE family transcriptional regulator
LTATQAAEHLGISRKSYYQWEQRALAALLQSLEKRPTGRPRRVPDRTSLRLQRQICKLERQLQKAQRLVKLRGILRRLDRQVANKKNRRPHSI